MSEFVSHPRWRALHTRSNSERLATRELPGKGLESFCAGLSGSEAISGRDAIEVEMIQSHSTKRA